MNIINEVNIFYGAHNDGDIGKVSNQLKALAEPKTNPSKWSIGAKFGTVGTKESESQIPNPQQSNPESDEQNTQYSFGANFGLYRNTLQTSSKQSSKSTSGVSNQTFGFGGPDQEIQATQTSLENNNEDKEEEEMIYLSDVYSGSPQVETFNSDDVTEIEPGAYSESPPVHAKTFNSDDVTEIEPNNEDKEEEEMIYLSDVYSGSPQVETFKSDDVTEVGPRSYVSTADLNAAKNALKMDQKKHKPVGTLELWDKRQKKHPKPLDLPQHIIKVGTGHYIIPLVDISTTVDNKHNVTPLSNTSESTLPTINERRI